MLKESRNMEYNPEMDIGVGGYMPGAECPPLCVPPVERICHRNYCHYVPHIQPVHTRIINHHVYKHTCTPSFSCSEENVISHVNEPPYLR